MSTEYDGQTSTRATAVIVVVVVVASVVLALGLAALGIALIAATEESALPTKFVLFGQTLESDSVGVAVVIGAGLIGLFGIRRALKYGERAQAQQVKALTKIAEATNGQDTKVKHVVGNDDERSS